MEAGVHLAEPAADVIETITYVVELVHDRFPKRV
jgi:hypothetical protein